MDLSPYLETVRDGVVNAASLGDDSTRQTAERLGGALEASTRLALIRALSDAAAQISAETAPTSVELRMNGPDPELVVLVPAPTPEPTLLLPDDFGPDTPDQDATLSDTEADPGKAGGSEDDEAVARISLRLPASVKAKVDEKADHDGISTNAWLLRAVMVALEDRPTPPLPPTRPGPPTEGGPFGPYGVFGPNGPFGAGGVFGGRGRRTGDDGPGAESARRGTVQGWVR
jgi:hypothetical protein